MKIFTYYSHVEGLNPEDELKLILLWRRHWTAYGFEPVVLGEHHAAKHPRYAEFLVRIAKLPSINPGAYDRACYLRWLAAAHAMPNVGGLLSDYDTFLYDRAWKPGRVARGKVITLMQGHVPSLAWGRPEAFDQVAEGIIHYDLDPKRDVQDGAPHISDMLMFAHGAIPFESRNIIKNYNEDGWQDAQLVHFSTSSMTPAKLLPRWKHVPTLRPVTPVQQAA
jgi:hypothetical protein